MGDTAPEDWLGQNGFDPIQCPHCDEVTTPNLLTDGSYVCSCTAERALPLEIAHGTPWDGTPVTMPGRARESKEGRTPPAYTHTAPLTTRACSCAGTRPPPGEAAPPR
jgi:hypothetical protein